MTLDKTKITIGIGETVKLTPTILPADASTAVVYWTQGPYAEKITVDDQGNVTGVGVGWNSVIVNVDGKTATCVTGKQDSTSHSSSDGCAPS